MPPAPTFMNPLPSGTVIAVKIQPRARKDSILSSPGPELRIALRAPPVDNAANEALVQLLAERLQCGRNQITILRGHHSRHKHIRITGLPPHAIAESLCPSP